jgi:hypothetical protein
MLTPYSSRQHEQARDWLDRQISGSQKIGLPWASPSRLLALDYKSPHRYEAASDGERVGTSGRMARGGERVGTLADGASFRSACPVVGPAGYSCNLVSDAHLAALAIEHGLLMCTTDRDFARFANLRWINPLAQG